MNVFSLYKILWGGRWQPNAAGGSGEEMEQLFSYLSRFNFTTKYMSAAGLLYNAVFPGVYIIVYRKRRAAYRGCNILEQQKNQESSRLFEASLGEGTCYRYTGIIAVSCINHVDTKRSL